MHMLFKTQLTNSRYIAKNTDMAQSNLKQTETSINLTYYIYIMSSCTAPQNANNLLTSRLTADMLMCRYKS